MLQPTRLVLEHTNPSLGPHEVVTTVSLSVTEAHETRIAQFLETATINNTTSLKTYIQAVHQQDEALLKQVNDNAPQEKLMQGGTISNFYLYFEGQPSIELYDVYRRYRLSHFYPDFTKYLVEQGTLDRIAVGDFMPKLKLKDEDRRSDSN
jgi:hypothetical protein